MGNHTATRARGRSGAAGGTSARSSASDKLAQAKQRVADAEDRLNSARAALRAAQGDFAATTVAWGGVGWGQHTKRLAQRRSLSRA